jgi:type IV secretory pathway TrbD component
MSAQHLPPGFEVPVFRSLYEPVLVGGVKREFAVTLWLATLLLVSEGGLRGMWPLLILAAVLHALVAIATKFDPQFLDVVGRAMRAPLRLDI